MTSQHGARRTTVLIDSLQIGGANAASGTLAVGYPALTAFFGFAQVVARAFAREKSGRFLHRFAIVHHEASPRLHGKWHDQMTERRYVYSVNDGAPSRKEQWLNPSSDPRPQVDLTCSLLLDIAIPPARLAHLQDSPDDATTCLGPRALGGVVKDCRRITFGGNGFDHLRALHRGHVIVDRTADLFPGDGRDALDVMLDTLSAERQPGDFDLPFPVQTGWLEISPLARRTVARGDTLHCHAEPILGLAAFRPAHRVLAAIDDVGTGKAAVTSLPLYWWEPCSDDIAHVLKGSH
jgi:hypothetical protein